MTVTNEEALAAGRLDPLAYTALCDPICPIPTPRHLRFIYDKLSGFYERPRLRLIIKCPPRHWKSRSVVNFIAHRLGTPRRRIIHATYGQDLSDEFGREIRNRLNTNEEHRAIFPDDQARLSPDSRSINQFATVGGAKYVAVGRGGAVTGKGGDVIIDDPIKNAIEAKNASLNRQVVQWFLSDIYTRLDPDDGIVVIGTPWTSDGLQCWLEEHHSDEWEVVSLPALAMENDPLGRMPGEALWPERFSVERLEQIKQSFISGHADEEVSGGLNGEWGWEALYQQNPVDKAGNMVQLDDLRWYKQGSIDFSKGRRIHSYDTAFKAKDLNDPTGFVDVVKLDGKYYLVEVRGRRLEFPELKKFVRRNFRATHPSGVLIEDKASGQSLIQDLKIESPEIPIISVKAESDKETRFSEVTDLFAANMIYLPENADWVPAFVKELLAFPAAPHDDMVDAVSQALRWLKIRGAGEARRIRYQLGTSRRVG